MARRTAIPLTATRVIIALLALLALGACDDSPYCSEFEDMAGRRVAFCPNPRQDPVCDLPGEEARFEESPTGGLGLVGGEYASCNGEGLVVCPMNTAGEPYCISDPSL